MILDEKKSVLNIQVWFSNFFLKFMSNIFRDTLSSNNFFVYISVACLHLVCLLTKFQSILLKSEWATEQLLEKNHDLSSVTVETSLKLYIQLTLSLKRNILAVFTPLIVVFLCGNKFFWIITSSSRKVIKLKYWNVPTLLKIYFEKVK